MMFSHTFLLFQSLLLELSLNCYLLLSKRQYIVHAPPCFWYRSKGFSQARRSCNLVVAALQARFLLSEPCGRRLLCTSVERNMTHTYLSHKNPRADTFLRQPSNAVQPKYGIPQEFPTREEKKKVDCRLSYDSFLAHASLQGKSPAFLATKTSRRDLQPALSSPIKVLLSLNGCVKQSF